MLVICPKKLFIGTEISGSLFTSLSNHNDYGDGKYDDYGDNDDDVFHLVTSILMVIIMATVMRLMMMVMILVMTLV